MFLVGDATDEIIASFPPSIMNRPTEGMIIVAQGLLGENEEFLVYRWSLPADTKAGATPETPLQTFFKPSAPPTTTSAAPTPSAPTTSSPQVTGTATTPAPVTPTTTLMCDQCNAGPFANALALQGHKTGAHGPKKTGKRIKKPGVLGFSPVAETSSKIAVPSSEVAVSSSPVASVSTISQPSQPPAVAPTAPTEPVSGPITLTASPEQSTLSSATTASTEKTSEQVEKTLEQSAQAQAITATPKETVKEEIKAVEGASEGSIKFAKVCGLIAKPLQEFKLHFEVNFPKDDMAKALEGADCTIVDGKVVFTGG